MSIKNPRFSSTSHLATAVTKGFNLGLISHIMPDFLQTLRFFKHAKLPTCFETFDLFLKPSASLQNALSSFRSTNAKTRRPCWAFLKLVLLEFLDKRSWYFPNRRLGEALHRLRYWSSAKKARLSAILNVKNVTAATRQRFADVYG